MVEDMKKYLLTESRTEIRYKDREEIKAGCASSEPDPDVIMEFDRKEDALHSLSDFQTDIAELRGAAGIYFSVTERYVEEFEDDESTGILEFSKMKIDLVGESGETISTFDNYADAENAENAYDGDEDVRISLW